MDSPLQYDKGIVKEFGINSELDIDPIIQLGFVRTQFEEIQKFLMRERVELILAEAQAKSDVEAIAAEAKTKVASHRNTIKGIVASLKVLLELKSELEAAIKG